MAINWRSGGLGLVTGVLLGAAGAVALVGQVGETEKPAAAALGGGTVQQVAATAPVPAAPPVSCSFAPIVAANGREDGLLPLDKDLQGTTSSAVNTLLLTGKESAAAGKMRDAETAFLMACRSAETLKRDPVPLADAHYQLGRHYAQVASVPNAPRREELLGRAERLYASSLQAYRAYRGENHEKTRFAQQGLDALKQLTAVTTAAAQPAAAPGPAPGTTAAENTRMAGAGPAPEPVPEPAPKVTAKPAETMTPTPPVAVAPQPAPKPQRKAEAKAPTVEEKPEAKAEARPVERPVRTARPAPEPVLPEPAPAAAPAPRETRETEILGGPPSTAAGEANAPILPE